MLRRIGCAALRANLVRSVVPEINSSTLATRSFTRCRILRKDDEKPIDGLHSKAYEEIQSEKHDEWEISTDVLEKTTEEEADIAGVSTLDGLPNKFSEELSNDAIATEEEPNDIITNEEEPEEVPWYMRGDEASELDQPIFKAEIPAIPEGAPESVEPLLKFCSDKLGLDDLKIFDIRGRKDIPVSNYIDFMIITSGKSDKHIQSATDELSTYIKQNMDSVPYVEGLLKVNSSKRQKRRIKKNVRKGGTADNEFGVGPNSWVMIDPQMDDIYIHILTPERRSNVNLEYLWCKPEEKELYEPKIEARVMEDVDDIFHGLQRRHYSTRVETDLSTRALQQFGIGDQEGLTKSYTELANQSDASLEVLQTINKQIGTLSIHEAIEDLSNPSNKYLNFHNSAFPSIPTLEHWQTRYELFLTLNRILPDVYPIENMTQVLLDQASAGEKITKDQYKQLSNDLLSTPQFGTELVTTRELMNKIFEVKFDNLRKIMRILRLQGDIEVDNEFIKDMLLLSSQYTTGEKDGPIVASKYFKVIIELYQNDHKFDNNVIYLSLNNLARAHDTWFWPFWDKLGSYETDLKSVSYDSRPWNVLIKVIEDSRNGKLVDDFIVQYTPVLINNKVALDDEMKQDILSIIQQHGGDIGAYAELVEYIQSQQ